MVRAILADANIEGHVEILLACLSSEPLRELWRALGLPVYSLADLGLDRGSPDADVWRICQEQQLVLITANRNADGLESLEQIIRAENTPESLPVITIADPEHLRTSAAYAAAAAEKWLHYLYDLDSLRGSGRLYIP